MHPPATLYAKLYLLAYDPRTNRVHARGQLGHLLRAAVLADLRLTGHLRDDDGEVRAHNGKPVADKVLADALSQIEEAPAARRWEYWIRRNARTAKKAVRDELESTGRIQVTKRRRVGPARYEEVVLPDLSIRRHIRDAVVAVLADEAPAASVEQQEVAMVALAAAVGLGTVLPWYRTSLVPAKRMPAPDLPAQRGRRASPPRAS